MMALNICGSPVRKFLWTFWSLEFWGGFWFLEKLYALALMLRARIWIQSFLKMWKTLATWSKLTPQYTILLYTLIVPQLVNKFPAYYGNRMFISVYTTACYWSLLRPRWIQITRIYRNSSNIQSNIILLLTLKNKEFSCITHTVEHIYISSSSTVGIQLHVSALYVGHLQVVI